MNNDLDKLNGLNNQSMTSSNSTMSPVQPTPMPTVEPAPMPTVEPTPMPTVEPTPMPTVEPTPMPTVEPTPMPTVEPTPMPTVEPAPMPTVEPANNNVNPMAAVENLNKEDAMEEALSHTNQYSPFEAPKQEVNKDVKRTSNKGAYILIGIIFIIMLLFIIFLPQISKLFGW